MILIGQQTSRVSQPFVHKAFEAHAERFPQRLALTCGENRLSYRELNERANQFAHYLTKRGFGPGSTVGVCLDRSPEMVISILGVLKAGAAYVPLDTTYPAERLRLMTSQLTGMKLIVASSATRAMISEADSEILDTAEVGAQLESFSQTNPVTEISESSICYVVFTSGSTGAPKAVAVRHEGWCNLLTWLVAEFHLNEDSNGLLLSPAGFDISQRALMTPLFAGSVLHLLPSRNFDVLMAYRLMRALRVRTLHCAPSALYLLLERDNAEGGNAFEALDLAFVGGEPIAASRVAGWATRPGNLARLVNVYGVAECTDVATAHVLTDYADYLSGGVPIGCPIYNVSIYVVDHSLAPVEPGEIGEICISGIGIGAGYLNDSQLNSERFVTVRYANGEVQLYRTGDLGRVRDDGKLMYVGRVDRQVKIRGMRVDLGDVEAALEANECVRQAIVLPVAGEGTGETLLMACVLPSDEATGVPFDARALRRDLLEVLPKPMVPREIVPVTRFPLSPNGKVDRDALALRVRESGRARPADNSP
jgi:D-alanine--poly(phosphoribitol) ligase subunit 1